LDNGGYKPRTRGGIFELLKNQRTKTTMTKKIYNYDSDGYFLNSSEARIDPLESKLKKTEIYLLPKSATFVQAPKAKTGKILKWDGTVWIFEDEKKDPEEQKLSKKEILENAKQEKTREIEAKKQQYQYSNIVYQNQEYLNNVKAQNKFFNLANSANSTIEWRLADGSWVILSRELINKIRTLINKRENASYKEESRLINLLEAAKNISELKSISWKLK
jgi:hypothetical protein